VLPTSASGGLLVGAGGEVFTSRESDAIEWRRGVPVAAYPVRAQRLCAGGLLYGDQGAVSLTSGAPVDEENAWLETMFEHRSFSLAKAQVSPDGLQAVRTVRWISHHPEETEPSSAREWKLIERSGAELARGAVPQHGAPSVAWGDTFVAISQPSDVQVYARAEGTLLATLPVEAANLHARGGELVTLEVDGAVAVWGSRQDQPAWAPRGVGSAGASAHSSAFHPSRPLLAVAEPRAVLVYDYSTSLSLVAVAETKGGVYAIAFGPGDTLWISEGRHQGRMPRVREFKMGPTK